MTSWEIGLQTHTLGTMRQWLQWRLAQRAVGARTGLAALGSQGRCERSLDNPVSIFQTDKWTGSTLCRVQRKEAACHLKRGSKRAGSASAFAPHCTSAHSGRLPFLEYAALHVSLSLYTRIHFLLSSKLIHVHDYKIQIYDKAYKKTLGVPLPPIPYSWVSPPRNTVFNFRSSWCCYLPSYF